MGRVITLAGATPDKMRVVAVVLSGLIAIKEIWISSDGRNT